LARPAAEWSKVFLKKFKVSVWRNLTLFKSHFLFQWFYGASTLVGKVLELVRCLTWSLLSAYHIGNLRTPQTYFVRYLFEFMVASCHKTLENRSAQIKCRSTSQFHCMSRVWLRGVQAQMQMDSGAYPQGFENTP
jgi:hypothetical protein